MTSEKAALVDDVEAGGRGGGDATFGMTVITLMKICVGTGVLAVPHAFSGAGVVPGFGMLFALLCWNDWSANRLLACRDLLSDDERRRFEAPGGEDVEKPEGGRPGTLSTLGGLGCHQLPRRTTQERE